MREEEGVGRRHEEQLMRHRGSLLHESRSRLLLPRKQARRHKLGEDESFLERVRLWLRLTHGRE